MDTTQFTNIAPHYDSLMAGVPYRLWVEYIKSLLDRAGFYPHTVLDVACGTGTVSAILKREGFDVTGVDIAPDMIEIAREKHPDMRFECQNMADMDMGAKFDLAVSLFDSLNYVTDENELAQGIKRISEHLHPGGLFIFDVNTVYALAHHFFDQANLESDRYPKYVWTSEFDHATRICRVNMIFTALENGKERQFKEVHIQKGYTLEELSQMLFDAGFEIVEILNAYKFKKPTRRSDRVYFVARKRNGA